MRIKLTANALSALSAAGRRLGCHRDDVVFELVGEVKCKTRQVGRASVVKSGTRLSEGIESKKSAVVQ